MARRRSLYYLRPIRPIQNSTEPPLTPETAPDRLAWLSGASGATARGAAEFNGSNQFLSAPSNPGLQTGGTNFFLACWALRSANGVLTLAARQVAPANREWILGYSTTGTFTTDRFFVRLGGDGTTYQVNGNTFGTWPIGQWAFVLAWRDLSNNTVNIRVNATAADQNTPGTDIAPTDAPLILGASRASTTPTYDRHHNGRLDQFIFGKPASIGSVISDIHATLYNGGAGRPYSQLSDAQKTAWGLVSCWELNEPSGTRLDAHGSNHLTAVGSPVSADGVVEGPAANLIPVRSWTGQEGAVLVQDTTSQRPTWRSDGRLVFDGVNDQISQANPLVGNRSTFTLFAKVRPDALPGTNPAVIFTEADGPGNVVNRLSVTPSGHVLASYRPSGGSLVHATSADPLAVGTESVVAVRRNGTSLQVFVDGVPSGPAATIDSGTSLTGATIRIGGPVESAGLSHLNGRIASVFASGQALTNAQVASLSGNL